MNWTSWGLSQRKTWVWIRTCVSTSAIILSPPSQWQISEVLSYTHALPSPVTNWICTSVYSLDRALTVTFSERNESKHILESLWVLGSSLWWSWLPGPAMTGAVVREMVSSVVIPHPQWSFPPWPKKFRLVYNGGGGKLMSEGLSTGWYYVSSSPQSLWAGRTGCWAAPTLRGATWGQQ